MVLLWQDDQHSLQMYICATNSKITNMVVALFPAWNDRNFAQICEGMVSDNVFAHVRAASASALSLENTHPFQFGR